MPKYKFSEIAYNINQKKMPEPGDEEMYIGLEHLDSGSLKVKRWGSDVPITGEKLVMKKGDILFGRRNTYLRRAAIAPHDGIFSAHGMIFRPNTAVMDEDYFPFFISSDYFMNAAIRISVGSLSPTVNWKTLKELEFDIPDLESQRKSAELLTAANRLKEAYEILLEETDQLVKSQFIEMFGTIESNEYALHKQAIGAFAEVKGGKRLPKGAEYSSVPTAHPYIRVVDLIDRTVNMADLQYLDDATQKSISRYIINVNDVYISIAGTIGQVGMVPKCLDGANLTENAAKIVLKNDAPVLPEYLMWYLTLPAGQQQIDSKTMHTTQPKLALFRIEEIEVLVPSFEQQKVFIEFAKQSDKSKLIKQSYQIHGKIRRNKDVYRIRF